MEPIVPWLQPTASSRFNSEQSAERIGHYAWLEMRLFETVGQWVGDTTDVAVAERLNAHCHQHAFHAELWHRRLPVFGDMDPTNLNKPGDSELPTLLSSIAEIDGVVGRLVAYYRVLLPNLIAGYTFHLNYTNEVSDAPTRRILRLALADDAEAWRDGEMMLQTVLLEALAEDPGVVERAATGQVELAKRLLGLGGVVGSGTLPTRTTN